MLKMNLEEKIKSFLDKEVSRREFITALAKTSAALWLSLKLSGCVDFMSIKERKKKINLKKAMFWKNLNLEDVQCLLCPNRCVIPKNGSGFCGIRKNIDGKLYTIAYSNPCAIHLDPIEKKPLYHFLPSATTLSLAIAGCCMKCAFCQNWEISQKTPDQTKNYRLQPLDIVEKAKELDADVIAYTYTEPTIFYEYMYDISKLARKKNIKNVIVTCGYINDEPFYELCNFLDSGNVNLKGFSDKVYGTLTTGSLEPILATAERFKEKKKWVEITYLVIPGYSDSITEIKNFCNWVLESLDEFTPVHFLRFFPAFKMRNLPPTPLKTLEKCWNLARDLGLKYVYIGNVPGHEGNNTYCHNCGYLLIKREGFFISQNKISNGKCPNCKTKIPGFWW